LPGVVLLQFNCSSTATVLYQLLERWFKQHLMAAELRSFQQRLEVSPVGAAVGYQRFKITWAWVTFHQLKAVSTE
jgi:hypothetical protein